MSTTARCCTWWVSSAAKLCATALLCSCSVLEPVDRAAQALDRTTATLDNNSREWQHALNALTATLVAQGNSTVANEVTQLAQRGIATAGTEMRCNADFIGQRMKAGLQRIKSGIVPFIHSESDPPKVCQVVPEAFKLDHCESIVGFYGYDFDATELTIFVQDYSGRLRDVSSRAARPTHYLMTLDTSRILLTASDEKILLVDSRHKERGAIYSYSIAVPPVQSTPPPPERHRQVVERLTGGVAGGLFGASYQPVTYGRSCTPGFQRQSCTVQKKSIDGGCLAFVPADPTDCHCTVKYSVPAFQGVDCEVQIWEIESPPPPYIPPRPPQCGMERP